MKKSTIIIFFVLSMLKVQAQDYLISFAGTGGSTTVDSVQVKNLTQNKSLTLNGTDILHLSATVGIGFSDRENGGLQLYPNPMNEESALTFVTPENGNAVVSINDFSGKTVYQVSTLLSPGTHCFRISGINQGMYFVKVSGKNYFYSAKLISQNHLQSNARIEHVFSLKIFPGNQLKSTAATVEMQYNDGDQLLYKGISGVYSTIFPDVPASSKTITFYFAACTDADNNNYSIVQIGTQTWMAENLNVGVRIDGVHEQTNNSTIERYCYNNDVTNCDTHGGLYQWNEMMQYVTTPGAQGICPTGWHIPTDAEWSTLITLLGGYSVAGGKMKSTGTIEAGTGLWLSPNIGATNESGFSAVPGGRRDPYGPFYYIGHDCRLWHSTEYGPIDVGAILLENGNIYVSPYMMDKERGISVRCVRDESIPFTCGSSITINHIAGDVSPVNKTVTYGTVNNIPGEPLKCWITSNLGADHQATAVDDATEASAGWYWQFNRKQGYKHDVTTRTPNTTWITPISENSDWAPANDPCTLAFGSGWRIPTETEWNNVDAGGNWTNWNGPWNSALKMHSAGFLYTTNGSLGYRGSNGIYWSGKQYDATNGWGLAFFSSGIFMVNDPKAFGFTARCVREN